MSRPLRLHLDPVPFGRRVFRVLTLTATCGVRFSNNYFHDTWHLLSDAPGAQVLARLLWGLSFQRAPDTLILVHGAHLVPTPFEGDRARPFVLRVLEDEALDARAVQRVLRHRPSNAGWRVKWQTFGLGSTNVPPARWHLHQLDQERVELLGGAICYSAPRAVMRSTANELARLRPTPESSDYHFLAHARDSPVPQGEVQVFAGFSELVRVASRARHEVVPDKTPFLHDEGARHRVWARAAELQRRKP